MATSGALATSNDNIKFKITITQNSQNVAGNTSNVTVSVRFYRTNTGYTTYGTGTVYLKINGTTYSESVTSDDKITSGGIVLISKTLNITHNADGTKTLATSAWISHSQFSATEKSYSMALTTIPRATTPTVNDSDVNLGESVTISTPRASTAFTHTLKYAFGSATGTIATGVATSRSWTIPLSLASQIPSATSGKLTITCETYNGSTKIGSKSLTITVRVPASVVPTISNVVITDTNSAQYTKFGGFVKDKSKATVTITASGAQGSKISSISTSGGGKTYSGASFTVSTLTTSGTVTFTVTVKDSRGRSASTTKSITVLNYDNPIIDFLTVVRANSDGTTNDEGTSLLVKYKFNISSISNKNDKSYTLEIKAPNATSYTTLASGTNVYALDTSLLVSNNISVDESYIIRLTVRDYFKTITYSVEAPTAFTLIDYHESGKGIAFGKVAQEDNAVEFGLPVQFNNGEAPNGALPLTTGYDLDNLVDIGYYTVPDTAISATLLNKPPLLPSTTATALIEVLPMGSGAQRLQRYTVCSKTDQITYQRVFYSNAWGDWFIVAGAEAWKTLTLASGFENYSDSTPPKYRANGNLVSVQGAVKPTTAFTGGATKTVFASGLPERYRPTTGQVFVCQGSGINRWLLGVETDGTLTVARYGTTEYITVPIGAWLIFNATYSI